MPRFFVPRAITPSLELDERAAHHALRVLRLQAGDPVVVFNGEGGEYEGVIAHCTKDSVSIEGLKFRDVERESPLRISLAQGISSAEKMDFTIQKAVELGVFRIQPIETARSVVRLRGERAEKRAAHWRRVVISACEQCGRNRLPDVRAIMSLEEWLPGLDDGVRWLLSPAARKSLRDMPAPVKRVTLLTGPEGGFSPEEERQAISAGFTALKLGPRILRTETAAVVALAAIQTLWGDF